jgi:hypothetical protein
MTVRPPRLPDTASEGGMALVSALLLLLVMSGLAMALTTSGRIEVAMGGNERLYASARLSAEAGLNHAAAIILGLTNTATFPNSLLRGPDGALNTATLTAAVNLDNGLISHLMPGGAACAADASLVCWLVETGSEYSYTVRLFDDDDPTLSRDPIQGFTLAERTAMGPPPDPAENGNPYEDVNKRIVIRATGFGPRGTTVRLEQMLVPIKMPALLVNGDLTMGGNAQVIGTHGSVHTNGSLTIEGNAVTIAQNATATGTINADAGWNPGQLKSGGMPNIPVPEVRASDYFSDADFVLQADGRITNKLESTTYCNAGTNSTACQSITPPGGNASFGWTFTAADGWDLSQNNANSATYYARTGGVGGGSGNVRITGNPGSSADPLSLTIIAEGNIQISGNPALRPEPLSEIQFVTNKDLWIHGNLGVPLAFEGRILVREQIDFAGNPTLAGQVIVQNSPTVSTLVTRNTVMGSVTLSYNGLAETVAYTVSGWRESQ